MAHAFHRKNSLRNPDRIQRGHEGRLCCSGAGSLFWRSPHRVLPIVRLGQAALRYGVRSPRSPKKKRGNPEKKKGNPEKKKGNPEKEKPRSKNKKDAAEKVAPSWRHVEFCAS
jgi:hypothetical protein